MAGGTEAEAAKGTERRQHERVEVRLPAQLLRLGGRELAVSAETLDLSEGGARVAAGPGFSVGDVVRLTIDGGELIVEHQGLVVGAETRADGVVVNVAFKSFDDAKAIDLRRIIDLA